jgi:hypothetical protein
VGGQARADRCVVGSGSAGARVDDDVHGWQLRLAVSERFAGQALQTIALDSVAGSLDTNRQAEPCATGVIRARDHREQRV